jgi:hypothetical protein
MHIPATDSLRHERVGLVDSEDSQMVLKTYVQTEETEARGAYDPIEGMARPFPLMLKATTPTVVETLVEKSDEISEFSETLLEYTKLLYESMDDGEWKDALGDFEQDEFRSEQEFEVAQMLFDFASRDIPRTLFRTVYRNASTYERDAEEDSALLSNALLDIEGREQYDFSYIPAIEDVDEWTLLFSNTDTETEEGRHIVSEIVWLNYTIGDTERERPILAYNNEDASYVVLSEDPSFGTSEMEDAPVSLIEDILNDTRTSKFNLSTLDSGELQNTRTRKYLEEFVNK